jgi:hypothetical protein
VEPVVKYSALLSLLLKSAIIAISPQSLLDEERDGSCVQVQMQGQLTISDYTPTYVVLVGEREHQLRVLSLSLVG